VTHAPQAARVGGPSIGGGLGHRNAAQRGRAGARVTRVHESTRGARRTECTRGTTPPSSRRMLSRRLVTASW
jgi:hypothetical protein